MGTVMNGNVWAGACVNGKVVSGLAKNGIVFYRKPVSTYKRRIIVGDSLGGKDIYNDFPTGYYSTFPTGTNSFTTLVESNGAPLIYENVINSPQNIEISSDEMVSGYSPYYYVDGEETISEKMTIDDYDTFDVTNITDNSSYRHLFIEDKNIRPLKVGDKIVPGTKFYGVVPDDPNLNNMNTSIYDTNGNSIAYFNFSENAFVNELQVKTNQYSYTIMYSKSQFGFVNNSVLVSEVSYTIGDISDSQSNPNYKYLLVDTTTLGA